MSILGVTIDIIAYQFQSQHVIG